MVTWFLILVSAALSIAFAKSHSNQERDSTSDDVNIAITNQYLAMPIFQQKMQFDVVTVLLLLGEATIWKSVWTKFRFHRCHRKRWIFAIAPGWAPLAGSLFAAMQGSRGPPNLIYDRPPPEALFPHLELTNLNSGATHKALHVVLQNIWQAWYHGPRKTGRKPHGEGKKYYVNKEVGIVDVNVSKLECASSWTFHIQSTCLFVQLAISLILGLLGLSLEVFVTFLVTLAAQGLLIMAITPSEYAWEYRDFTRHKVAPMMLHMGMDSASVLFVRSASKDPEGTFSLEEYCWESQTIRSPSDIIPLLLAGFSFCMFVFQLILIGWMSDPSRLIFLVLGALGLIVNAIEGAIEPDWKSAYEGAFSGKDSCEPNGSSLMGAVGLLLGGKFAAGEAAAKLLYPDNDRFQQTISNLRTVLEPNICEQCSKNIRGETGNCSLIDGVRCSTGLTRAIKALDTSTNPDNKKVQDALETVVRCLTPGTGDSVSNTNADSNARSHCMTARKIFKGQRRKSLHASPEQEP
jgi:hypothetical protein